MRQVVSGSAKDHNAASSSQTGSFETEILTQPNNLNVLISLPGPWVDQVDLRKPLAKLILDMDSSDIGENGMIAHNVENNRCRYQGGWLRCASGSRCRIHKVRKGLDLQQHQTRAV